MKKLTALLFCICAIVSCDIRAASTQAAPESSDDALNSLDALLSDAPADSSPEVDNAAPLADTASSSTSSDQVQKSAPKKAAPKKSSIDDESDEANVALVYDDTPGSATYSPADGAEITLPLIGPFVFAPAAEFIAQSKASAAGKSRQGAAAAQKKDYAIGRLQLQNLTGSVSNEGRLLIDGACTISGYSGKISCIRYNPDKKSLVLQVAFSAPVKFPIYPGKELSITTCLLVVEESSQSLLTKQSVFTADGNESVVSFDLAVANNAGAKGTVKSAILLSDVIAPAKNNKDFAQVKLVNVSVGAPNPFAPDATAGQALPTTTLTATAKLSSVILYGQTHLADSDCTITMTGPNVSFSASGTTPINLATGFVLESPEISSSVMVGQPAIDLDISGTIKADLGPLGIVNVPATGSKSTGFFSLDGKIQNSIHFGPVKFRDPSLKLTAQDDGSGQNQLQVQVRGGTFDVIGISVTPILDFISPGQGQKRIMQFSGEVAGGKPIKPLDLIPGLKEIPGIKDFILDKANMGLDTQKAYFLGGETALFNIATKARVSLGAAKSVMASSLKAWKISDSFPSLKGNPLDALVFESITFGFVKNSYFNTEVGMVMEPGLNMFGALDMSQGPFKSLNKMLGGIIPKKLIGGVTIHFDNPLLSKVTVAIPIDLHITKNVSLQNIAFELGFDGSKTLLLSIRFDPGHGQPPLLFTGSVEFAIAWYTIAGTMQGMWKNPFGIPGISIGDVAIEVSGSYVPATPLLGLGVAGTVALGDFLAKAAVKVGPPNQAVVLAEVSELPFFIFPSLLKMVGLDLGPLDILKKIDLSLHDAKFKFAPAGGQIGQLYFDPGISASGKLTINIPYIFKSYLEFGFNLAWTSGFKLYAQMPKCHLGPLKLSGRNKNRKFTDDSGPILYAAFSLSEQRIYISALAELFNNSAEIEVDVGLTYLRFRMLLKLLGLLTVNVLGETYRKGWRLGFKLQGVMKLGKNSQINVLGDINTLGCNFAGKCANLGLTDLLESCDIPAGVIPNIGLKDLEFYVRAQG